MAISYKGKRPAVAAQVEIPDLKPNQPFVLEVHPLRWQFVDGEFLPLIHKWHLRPGTLGVKEGPGGHNQAIVERQTAGWMQLPQNVKVIYYDEDEERMEENGYTLKIEGRRGPFYHDVWTRPTMTGHGIRKKLDLNTDYDTEGHDEWRRWLLSSGIVPQPEKSVLKSIIKRQMLRRDRNAKLAHDGNPTMQKRLKREDDTLQAMRQAMAKLYPAKKRKPKAKVKKVAANG